MVEELFSHIITEVRSRYNVIQSQLGFTLWGKACSEAAQCLLNKTPNGVTVGYVNYWAVTETYHDQSHRSAEEITIENISFEETVTVFEAEAESGS